MSEKHEHGGCCGGHDHDHDHEPPKESFVLNADVKVCGETTLRVAGMDCADEVAAIERVLKPLSGVREVRVNLMGGKVTVAHDASIQPEKLITAIATAGLKAQLDKAGVSDDSFAVAQRARLI